MTKIQEMLNAGLPIKKKESNEDDGRYVFESLTDEQETIYRDIVNPPNRDELRRRAYVAEGITVDALIVAMVEKHEEGRPEAMVALQAKRLIIKDKIK